MKCIVTTVSVSSSILCFTCDADHSEEECTLINVIIYLSN